MTDAVHARGARIVVQLMHTGRIAHRDNLPQGAEVVAPSAVPAGGQIWTDTQAMQPHTAPREMTDADIAAALADFSAAARLARHAGFDGVEVHGANGYLVEQFLYPSANRPTDAYGGSPERCARFALEAVGAVAAEVGAARTGIRLSPHGRNGDLGAHDDAGIAYAFLARELQALGAGYLHLVDHSAMGGAAVPPETVDGIRAGFTGTLIRTGGFTAAEADALLARGGADLVGFGCPFLANPDLVERFATGAPLASPDPATFYAPGPNGLANGYTDYPALAHEAA